MTPHYADDKVTLYAGDCLDVLRELPDASVDAVVTDPPYGLEFMGKEWDSFAPQDRKNASVWNGRRQAQEGWEDDAAARSGKGGGGPSYRSGSTYKGAKRCDLCGKRQFSGSPCICLEPQWTVEHRQEAPSAMIAFQAWATEWTRECYRVLKPGGHLLAFGGTRTWHRLACAVEDAGFEVRDSIAWMYGSGFPKSLDVSKAIDKAAGAEREVMTVERTPFKTDLARERGVAYTAAVDATGDTRPLDSDGYQLRVTTAPATPEAEQWQGWGTAMKPAHEPVLCARKPAQPSDILARIGSHLDALEEECRRRASDAAASSAPTRHASPEARTASAPERAATPPEGELGRTTPTGAAGASSGVTATSASESMAATFSSTVTSWRACWVEICEATSTSTTSTATSATTDLTTLSSCLSSITQSVTGPSTLDQGSLRSLAEVADNLFAAGVLSSRSTLALSVIESATSETPPTSQDAAGSSPAFEPIVVARKPLVGTVAANVLEHGTGALNVDGCRVGDGEDRSSGGNQGSMPQPMSWGEATGRSRPMGGRWPANVVLDESQAAELDAQSGACPSGIAVTRNGGGRKIFGGLAGNENDGRAVPDSGYSDTGGASRFFYVAKAGSAERVRVGDVAHPTVKPIALMRWLVRLVTPPGGVVLEPFAGSGTTVEACVVESFACIAIEREADYLPLILERIRRGREPGPIAKASPPPPESQDTFDWAL